MQRNNYKAVGFDYGGVLETYQNPYPFEKAASIAGVTLDDYRREYLKRNHLSNVHNLDWYEVIRQTFEALGTSLERQAEAVALLRNHESGAVLNTELLAYIRELRAQGCKVGLLSNAWATRREIVEDNGVAALFDAVIISGEIGAQKPDREAFDPLFRALEVEPSELVFVDDSPFSLAKASEIGYTPILYKNNEQLFTDLQRVGIGLVNK